MTLSKARSLGMGDVFIIDAQCQTTRMAVGQLALVIDRKKDVLWSKLTLLTPIGITTLFIYEDLMNKRWGRQDDQ